ncbi:MAG TPA: 3-oxoadipate enol-lactonase [Beijerinckiaceae bacterium]|nr:3-oxoadipate enol-lactonase [Beijerinckiaceae bacterium]
MPILNIAGEPFHYRLDGPENAPVLMLSNSLGTDLGMWDQQVEAWSKTYRVLRYDSRGHGRSVVSDGPYSIARLGQDALAIMMELGVKKTHWCGLSKGGMVGQWLLTHAPERIGRAVLANTACVMGPPGLWNDRIRTVMSRGMGPVADALADRWFTRKFQAAHPKTVAKFVETMRAQNPKGYAGCCAAIRDMDQSETIRSVRNPVLVIAGSADPATPPARAQAIAERIKGAKLVTLDAAHLSNVEQPQAFARAVQDFLA